jgi:hypothetical protein
MSNDYEFIEIDTGDFNLPYSTKRSDETTQTPEKNDGEYLTIEAGYVDTKLQVQNMIMGGEMLNSYRFYDDEEALENEDFARRIAEIRHPNTDITEIKTYTEALNQRIEQAQSEAERKSARQSINLDNTKKSYDKKNPDQPPEEPPEE